MKPVQQVLLDGINFLKENNIVSYNIDAKVLLMHILKVSKVELLTSRDNISLENQNEYVNLLKKRATGYPVAYIVGHVEFMSLPFNICEKVLIPRGDTEILVEKVILEINQKGYKKLLDVCTGSGCIPISVSKYTDVTSIGLEIDTTPFFLSKENAILNNVTNKVTFIQSDLFKNLDKSETFDIITSNPPYISKDEMNELMTDVHDFEPHLALYGGQDGLSFYPVIAKKSYSILNNNGMLILEIGMHQGNSVKNILYTNNFKDIEILKDLQGHDRVVLGFKRR